MIFDYNGIKHAVAPSAIHAGYWTLKREINGKWQHYYVFTKVSTEQEALKWAKKEATTWLVR